MDRWKTALNKFKATNSETQESKAFGRLSTFSDSYRFRNREEMHRRVLTRAEYNVIR